MNNQSRLPANEGKPHKIPISFPDEMVKKLTEIGNKSGTRFSAMVKIAIAKYIEAYEKKNANSK